MRFAVWSFALLALGGQVARVDADQPKESSVSVSTRVANEVDQYEADVRALDREFAETYAQMKLEYEKRRKTLRNKVAKKLSAEQKRLTQAGDLDEAIAVRSQVQGLNKQAINMPMFGAAGSQAMGDRAILGNWRWNNGVDIANLEDGKTSGRGTWQLLDKEDRTYRFNWFKIPADRVRLSKNGRVLEGTKENDPSFRVWAVRID